MEGAGLGAAAFAVALALILGGLPVAVALGLTGAAGFLWLNGWSGLAFVLGSTPFEAVFPYSLSVVPLFILMGVFAARAGLSQTLFEAVDAFVGRARGGLAVAAVGACALFGAICGSSLATAATMGRVAIPEMRARGYDDGLAAASVAAGGTLGVLIPPSIILVIYGLLTETSIGALFIGAILPGLLGTVLYALAVVARVRTRPELAPDPPSRMVGRRRRAVVDVWPVALLFTLVIGGIYVGWFSPTEAAAVGALGAVALAAALGGLTRTALSESVRETAGTCGMIFLILIGATLFNFTLEQTGLPEALVAALSAADIGPLGAILLLTAFYLVLGCLMDSLSMVLLTVPLVFPVTLAFGLDPVWTGVFVVTVAEIGLITPPVGMNLFVIQGVAPGLSQRTIVKGIVPFVLADLLRLAILVAVPALVLWLPARAGL